MRRVATLILVGFTSIQTFGNPLSGLFGGGAPNFDLLKFMDKPFEELRLDRAVSFEKEPVAAKDFWNCSPQDNCTYYGYTKYNTCFQHYISVVERAGKIVSIDTGYNDYLRCPKVFEDFKRVKDQIGNTRKPDIIFKPSNGGDFIQGSAFSGVWADGDKITKVNALCPIVDAQTRRFENFRNCYVFASAQQKCMNEKCKDVSSLKKLKQYDY